MPKQQHKPKRPAPFMSRCIRLKPDDITRLNGLQAKYPEMNQSSLLRRALRELAEREQVA